MELVEVRNSHTSACRDVVAALNYPRAERDSGIPMENGRSLVYSTMRISGSFWLRSTVRATTSPKSGRLLHEWQMSARTMSDPIAREILDGRTVDDDWVEVTAAPR